MTDRGVHRWRTVGDNGGPKSTWQARRVSRVPGPVVVAGGAGVGVAGGVLHPVQRHPGVQGQGHERVPQVVRVQAFRLVHSGGGCEAAYQPGSAE